jgi:hypothetical protein
LPFTECPNAQTLQYWQLVKFDNLIIGYTKRIFAFQFIVYIIYLSTSSGHVANSLFFGC